MLPDYKWWFLPKARAGAEGHVGVGMCLHSSVVIAIILNNIQSYIYYLDLFQQLNSEQTILLNLMKHTQLKERAGQLIGILTGRNVHIQPLWPDTGDFAG